MTRRRATVRWPKRIDLVVFDFDGVHTDNRVFVFDDGREAVICSREDGLGVAALRRAGVPMLVVSTETHAVVARRCEKLKLECHHGIDDKGAYLAALLRDRGVAAANVIYLGNDINDLGCFKLVGMPVAVGDAFPGVLKHVQLHLSKPGGNGAVRELADLVLARLELAP